VTQGMNSEINKKKIVKLLYATATLLFIIVGCRKKEPESRQVITADEKQQDRVIMPTKSLHVAAAIGDVNQVKLLISSGADVNAQDRDGTTPLHLSAINGHRNVAELLLDSGADIDATRMINTISGLTPLYE